jgi:hypothetical protein
VLVDPGQNLLIDALQQDDILLVVLLHALPCGLVASHALNSQLMPFMLDLAAYLEGLGYVVELVGGKAELALAGHEQVDLFIRSWRGEAVQQEFFVERGNVELHAVIGNDGVGLVHQPVDGMEHHLGLVLVDGIEVDLFLIKPLGGPAEGMTAFHDLVDCYVLLPQTPYVR